MVLRLDPEETVRKSILVKNINDVPVTIDLIVSGDLEKDIILEEETFVLLSQTDKKAYFTLKAQKSGSTETNINVRFTPEEGNGVGFSSKIIVVVSDDDDDDEDTDEDTTSEDPNEDPDEDTSDQGFSFNPGGAPSTIEEQSKTKFSPLTFLLIFPLILVTILILLVIYAEKSKSKKKGTGRRNA